MIEKEELIERIENTLTTRTVKELFKSIVEQCRDVPIPQKEEKPKECGLNWDSAFNCGFAEGWNACIEEMSEEEVK